MVGFIDKNILLPYGACNVNMHVHVSNYPL